MLPLDDTSSTFAYQSVTVHRMSTDEWCKLHKPYSTLTVGRGTLERKGDGRAVMTLEDERDRQKVRAMQQALVNECDAERCHLPMAGDHQQDVGPEFSVSTHYYVVGTDISHTWRYSKNLPPPPSPWSFERALLSLMPSWLWSTTAEWGCTWTLDACEVTCWEQLLP